MYLDRLRLWLAHELPAAIAKQAIALVHSLGLRFAGIDLILSRERYVFVELNPNGTVAKPQAAEQTLQHALFPDRQVPRSRQGRALLRRETR